MIDSPLVALALLAALVAVPLVLRRVRGAAPDGVRVVARTALSKGVVVAVLAVGDRRLLVGAGERGVQLLTELEPDAAATADATSTSTDTTMTAEDLRGRDAATLLETWSDRATPSPGLTDGRRTTPSTAGPRTGLVDRLRAMTVRAPDQGRPVRVPLLRR